MSMYYYKNYILMNIIEQSAEALGGVDRIRGLHTLYTTMDMLNTHTCGEVEILLHHRCILKIIRVY